MRAVAPPCVPGLPAGSRVAERRLDSGLGLLAVEVPTARTVRLAAAVGAGYLAEPARFYGLAHLLEHALFLGSQQHPRPGEFAAWVGEQGGRYNARTDEAVTDFHVNLPPAAAREGLSRLVDLLTRPCLEEAAVGREVDVLDAEFRARLADPALHRQAALSRLFNPDHPAHHCHAGHRHSLGDDAVALCHQLAEFHAAHYHSERMSLVMLGSAPLATQLALLAEAGQAVPGRACPASGDVREVAGRWQAPAHVQWCLPQALPRQSPRLELLWPLPPALEVNHPGLGESLAATLCDGRLAATLQRQLTITDLSASTRADGTGPALSLSLALTDVGVRCIDRLRATCQIAVHDLPAVIAERSPTVFVLDQDLDRWPLEQARRLVRGGPRVQPGHAMLDDEVRRQLARALAPSACRTLQAVSAPEGAMRTVPDTGTPFRWRTPRSGAVMATPPAVWPLRPAPAAEARPLAASVDEARPGKLTPGRLDASPGLVLWWGGGPRLPDASWCLAWAAPSVGQASRLAAWQQSTLALRQAARAGGIRLSLGGDQRGDWLMVRGRAEHLEAVVTGAVAAWRARPHVPPANGGGLLAQRLLSRLERPRLVEEKQQAGSPSLLCWVSGTLPAAVASGGCRRLASRAAVLLDTRASGASSLPEERSETTPSTLCWLPPQAEDHALMLQVDGPDASPTSRLVLWLLAHCHDATFFNELRRRRGLGYVAAVRYREADGWPRLGYVVQSPQAGVAVLRQAISAFLAEHGVALASLGEACWARRRDSLRAAWGPPETPDEAVAAGWHALREATFGGSTREVSPTLLSPWKAMTQAMAELGPETVQAYAEALVNGTLRRQWWAHSPADESASRYA